MANRGMICPKCGHVQRVACERLLSGVGSSNWPMHCDKSMLILGYRQSQAISKLTADERIRWVALGGPIRKGRGRKRWQAILSESRLDERYPSP